MVEAMLFGAAALLSAVITGVIRRQALARGMLDVPNARSSHSVPTPRGGGLGIVLVTVAGLALLAWCGRLDLPLLLALTGGGLAVAAIGFIDDRRSVPATVRLLVHVAAALWAVWWLGGLPPIRFGSDVYVFGLGGSVLAVMGIVWSLNLFNFMDGIDGIAGGEAVFMCLAAVLVAALAGSGTLNNPAALVLAGATAGFLFWNWPPARVFMGDVGSGFLGFALAVLALAAARTDPVALLVWSILGAFFIADSGVTLVRRMLRRARLHEAHRSHAYQHLAQRWQSHRRVTIAVLLGNLLWLLPCAVFGALHPGLAGYSALAAFVPAILIVIALGAGRES